MTKPLPDDKARLRALTDHWSTLLVEAGAGSGKTALMAGRVVLLFAAGVAPRQIAAITFTELAAGQLFTRIAEFLDQVLAGELPPGMDAALSKGLTPGQRANLEAARQSIGELTATTIHGFCQGLIRPYPVEAGMDPGARVMDPAAATLAWEDLVEAFLRERLDTDTPDGAVAAYVVAAGPAAEGKLQKIAEAVEDHRTARPAAAGDWRPALAALESAVAGFVAWLNGVGFLEETTAELADELRVLVERYRTLLSGGDPVGLMQCADDPPVCSAHTQKLIWRKWGRKGKWQAVAGQHGRSKAEGARIADEGDALYQAVGAAWAALQPLVGAAAFSALVEELRETLQSFREYKRDAALLDFEDLLQQARELLRSHEPVRQALSRRYRHVLVDEFQDTDPVQAEILWRLCGEGAPGLPWAERQLRPGALFCVGDPKQAIYRFRGADVDTYVQAREAIRRQHPGNILEVTANFRSLEPILTWVNERFRGPLSADQQPGFQDLSATRRPPNDEPRVVRLDVQVTGLEEDEEPGVNDIREAEARAVAALCKRLIGSQRLQVQRDDPLARPGDIALLAPGGTQLWRYERALEELGIPVASQAGKGFFRRQEIQDLIAITRTLADARDTVAFGALLRGPVVGLTEEELLDIVAGLPANEGHDGIPKLTLHTDAELVANPVAGEVLRILQGLYRRARGTTPFDLLAQAVEELRVRAVIRQRHPGGAERALANVDLFLEMARPYAVRGLRSFATDMRAKWEDAESQVEGRPDAEEQAVNLITMHSAKGLEWPIVIPVNTCSDWSGTSGILHDRVRDELHGPFGAVATAAYEALKAEEDAQGEREDIRLLYVACTRAAELLVLPNLSGGKSPWLKRVELGIPELPALDLIHLGDALPPRPADTVNKQTAKLFAQEGGRIAAATRSVEWRQPSRHEGVGDAPVEEESGSRDWPEEDFARPAIRGGAVRGRVLHKLLEEILTGELVEEAGVLEARAGELLVQLGEMPVDDPARGFSPGEMAAVVQATLAMPEIAGVRGRLVVEVPVYGCVVDSGQPNREIATAGIADALVLDEAGKVTTVIDWKSDVAPTGEQRAKYRQQLKDYLALTGAGRGLLVYMTSGQVDAVL
ncbi:MAG: UvrD-helicase domain-containing protein [Chromatiales bacterium]|nr:UvrD-helicase domain-containing protein [Chromatiales bacterium]